MRELFSLFILKWIFLVVVYIYGELSASPLVLANLEYSNPALKELRADIKENLRISKSGGASERIIPLKYYQYKVKKTDQFFQIMARTQMDMETLSSVNELSSPHDLVPGMVLEIPNMRGVFHPEITDSSQDTKLRLAEKYKYDPELMQYDSNREKWFFPGLVMGKTEKSFFYGFGFSVPLEDFAMSSSFGKRLDPFTKKVTFHGGIDLAAAIGTPVYASQDGTIQFANIQGGYGNLIVVKHIMGYETRYGHLSKFLVKEGEKVKKGQIIGEVGITGRTTGPHLHFEIRRNSKRQRPFFQAH
ncbi:LysM peptidoglycan-binding domain-containing M23 family metallopeptidase [Leptospira ryugenii]|uniref:LysM peptidoglycan-binding domain-containing M23 family metallopeptidase n=1 Tax=Leptospira ryugenii TaxID=1917863 RepID=UPI003F767AE2